MLLFYVLFCLGHESCGILSPRAGTELSPSALEGKVLPTGPPGKSPLGIFKCPHKAPHMGWLGTIEMCSLTELGAGSLNYGWQQGRAPSNICRNGSFLPLPASGRGWPLTASLALSRAALVLPLLSYGSACPLCASPSLIKRPVILAEGLPCSSMASFLT